jgi:hypothetical protein
MANQLQGEILFKGIDPASAWVYSPWMPVRGDSAVFGVEVLQINGVTLTWSVETRNAEDPTTSVIVADRTLTTVTVDAVQNTSSAKQFVRYRFATGATSDVTKWVQLRALIPSWQVDR